LRKSPFVGKRDSAEMVASRIVAVVASLAALGSARLAGAQPKPMVVIWQAPPGCPTAANVQAEVEGNLARSVAGPVPVVALVNVRGPTSGRWQASLLFQAGYTRAERRFEAESCAAIASAAALIITLWAEGGPDAPPPTTAAQDSQKPSVAPGGAPGGPGFVLMLNGLLDWGTMPDQPAGGMEAAGGPIWTVSGWRLRALGGLSFFPNRRTPLTGAAEQADFELFDVLARGCATVVISRVELGPCAGAELAFMHGSGTSFQDSTHGWLSLSASALVELSISPAVAVFGRAEVVVPTTGKTFLDPVQNTVYQVPDVAVRGALGIELRF
jgi:hypothetical protein